MLRKAVRRFFEFEAAGGILLVAAALCALVVANLPLVGEYYDALLRLRIEVTLGPLELKKNFLLVVNDGLMAIFFLLVALEIKREVIQGELSKPSQMLLPMVAAVGGVLCPSLIFWVINRGDPLAMRGWAIPAATDIAFSLGVVSLLGKRVPAALTVFLTTVAVVDDLIAILIIAVFYTSKLSFLALGLAICGLTLLVLLNRRGVASFLPYAAVGIFMWVCVLKSGVHATLAGVALGFCIPFRILRGNSGEALEGGGNVSPGLRLERELHPWVAWVILPLFAFANAGVHLSGVTMDAMLSGVSLGIALGLFLGKPIGIFVSSYALIKLGIVSMPTGASFAQILGIGFLAGIGFTMSLFIGGLSYDVLAPHFAVLMKVGVFVGSLASAIVGFAFLRSISRGDVSKAQF